MYVCCERSCRDGNERMARPLIPADGNDVGFRQHYLHAGINACETSDKTGVWAEDLSMCRRLFELETTYQALQACSPRRR